MDRLISVVQVVAPIFAAIFLGVFARKKSLMTVDGIRGLQQFVMNFGLPCVVFNSCLTADIGRESLTSMALVAPLMLAGNLWSFRARKNQFPYHNFPQLFAAQETGMLGIPLYMILFGADQAYRMGVLDLAQAPIAFPVIALLSADAGENPTPGEIFKKVLTSPLMVMSLSALALNLSGIGAWMDAVRLGGIVTACTGFLAQPVSAMMIFCVGYNFSLAKGNRRAIFRISAIHFTLLAVFCLIIQGILFLLPDVDALTRWALFLYCMLPGSYLAPTLGRTEDDFAIASGVCSLLTVSCLVVFCCMAVITA